MDLAPHSTMCNSGKGEHLQDVSAETRAIHAGVHHDEWTTDPLGRSFVSPPVNHASTIIFPDLAALRRMRAGIPFSGLSYGGLGTTVHYALEEAFASIEGGTNALSLSSGTAAVAAVLLTYARPNAHVLVSDGVYRGTRAFCDTVLRTRTGAEVTYFNPALGADAVAALVRAETAAVFLECPASYGFELHDVGAIAAGARARNPAVKTLVDNSWGPGILRPLALGADVSVCAASKYVGGHGDVVLGLVAARAEDDHRAVRSTAMCLGIAPGPDDAFLALRGLRTLPLRMERHARGALAVARWLEAREEVRGVMHPALESHTQHALFKRIYAGSAGTFGFQLRDGFSDQAVEAMVDGMRFFLIGNSWGGPQSLLIPTDINKNRSVVLWKYGDGYGQTFRIHVGLEGIEDLLGDLGDGFDRMNRFCMKAAVVQ